jgi:FkbM family methyltransferase
MKEKLNRMLRKFGAEIHGVGYLQSIQKAEFRKDSFTTQRELFKGQKIKTIFDLGANRGDIAARYRNEFPEAAIYAFEPFPGSFDQLRQRFVNDQMVFCNQLAVAENKSILPFYVNKNVDTNSLLKSAKIGLSSDSQVANESVIEVPCIKLDDFCDENNIAGIDILKMDIQGGEFNALRGAVNLLRGKKIKLIYLEAYYREQYVDQPLFHDISKLLHGYGYYLQDIYHPIYGKGSMAWSDVIFLPFTN